MIENTTLTASDILRMQSRLAAYLTTYLPNVNLQAGSAMHDLVIKSLAHVLVLVEKEAEEVQSRYNLVKLADREDTTSRLMLDDALSNWFIERRLGGLSTVMVTLEFSNPIQFTLDSTYIFSRGEAVSFSPNTAFSRTYTTSSFSSTTNQDGTITYYLNVMLTSNNPGLGSSLPAGEFYINKAIPGFTRAYSKASSSTITANETNYQLVKRAKESLSFRGMSTSKSIVATINDLNLTNVLNILVVKSGEPEMFRDLLATNEVLVTPIHTLGKADVVVSLDKALTDTGLLSTNSNSKVVLDTGTASIAYQIYNVRVSGSSVKIVSFYPYEALDGTTKYYKVSRLMNDSTGAYSNSVSIVGSSVLASDECEVEYGSTETKGFTTQQVLVKFSSARTNVSLEYIQGVNLGTIQDTLDDADLSSVTSSLKAKLATLVEVKIPKIKYYRNVNSPISVIPDSIIRSGIAEYINSYVGTLSVSSIVTYLSTNFYQFISSVLSDMEIEYSISLPQSGTIIYSNVSPILSVEDLGNQIKPSEYLSSSSSVISISELNSLGISDRTITYYCNPDSIVLEQQ